MEDNQFIYELVPWSVVGSECSMDEGVVNSVYENGVRGDFNKTTTMTGSVTANGNLSVNMPELEPAKKYIVAVRGTISYDILESITFVTFKFAGETRDYYLNIHENNTNIYLIYFIKPENVTAFELSSPIQITNVNLNFTCTPF